jgi:hypothetical protein
MAVNDRVKTREDIASFDPKTKKFLPNAIPQGTVGTIIKEDLAQRVVVVKFDNGLTGVFGSRESGLPDTIDLLQQVSNPSGSIF